MNIEQLIQIGRTLYGTQWQSELARSLNIDSRRVRQWLKNERPIPEWLKPELKKLLSANIADAQAKLEELGD